MSCTDKYATGAMFAYLQKTSLFSFACPRMDCTAFRGAFRHRKVVAPLEVTTEVWQSLAEQLQSPTVVLLKSDFEATMDRAKRGDFIFLDPPYAEGTRTRVYLKFTKNDHERLMRKIKDVTARGVYVMLFNHADIDLKKNPELSALTSVSRPQNGFANYVEYLYINY